MDSLISEMEKLLSSSKDNLDIQNLIGDSAEKNIDDLLNEADKIINEILPYFQSTSNTKKIKTLNNFECIKVNSKIKITQPKNQQNNKKKVVFNLKNNYQSINIPVKHSKTSEIYGKLTTNKCTIDEQLKNSMTSEFKIPKANFLKNNLHICSSMIENHNRLQIISNKQNKLANNLKTQTQSQISKYKLNEELNYYKLKNKELEENLMIKEQEICNWKNRYQQLNQYCESVLKKNIDKTLKNYDCQLNELIERNSIRESQLHIIIGNLLEEIDQSHLQYRIKLSEKNKQIHIYLDQIEKILGSVYKFRNNNVIR